MTDLVNYLFDHPYILIILLTWSFVWKGLALWKAARKYSKGWFIALLVVNTAGLLEILYFYIFSRKGEKTAKNKK